MSNVRLIWSTPEAEKLIAYIARVSNPGNQDNPNYAKLIKYLIDNRHWSPFEMASMCIEIETSMAIGEQILRHRSFSFQKFSGRYSNIMEELGFENIEIRQQATKNRQSSTDVFNPIVHQGVMEDDLGEYAYSYTAEERIKFAQDVCASVYEELINAGVAKECARMVLPASTRTRFYMAGTIRSWIHYLDIRTDEHTQKEHRELAEQIKTIFINQLPTVSAALGWTGE